MSERRGRLRRREFVCAAVSVGLGGFFVSVQGSGRGQEPIRFGLVTDVHYAEADPRGTRHYRDSMAKLAEAIETFNRLRPAFLIELGDFIDSGKTKADEIAFLHKIDKVYRRFRGPRHYVLGNHCLNALTKAEFLQNCGATIKRSYYSFDLAGWHFVVLDANFRTDGTPYAAGNFEWTDTFIPAAELEWLEHDLEQAKDRKAIVFVHQTLDKDGDPHNVKNAAAVRNVLERAANVLAVFQGHRHVGGYSKLESIHYVTLKAMVEGPGLENNKYGLAVFQPAGPCKLEGFGRQPDVPLGQ